MTGKFKNLPEFYFFIQGHHVWNIIRSKSVFTRVTDGQRLRYYSAYIIIMTIIVTTIAVCIHFYVEEKQEVGQHKLGKYLCGIYNDYFLNDQKNAR